MGGGADPLPRRPTAFTSATLQAGDSSDAEDEAMRSRYLPTMEVAMVTIPDAPLRPMAPGDLIARATEMLASFDGDKVSPDAHAERCLDEWRVREASDATFIRQCFYGCVRYAKMLGAFTKTMYHARGGDILRSDRDLYTVYAYLLLLRLDELGWDQFEQLLGANSEQKLLPLMKFAFDERVLDDLMRDQWLKIYDPPWVDNVLASLLSWRHEADDLIARYEDEVHFAKLGDGARERHESWMTTDAIENELGGRKGPKLNGVTVPKPFKLHPPKPKPLPARYQPPKKPKPQTRAGVEQAAVGNRRAHRRATGGSKGGGSKRGEGEAKLEEANRMAFKLAAVERPTNLDAVRAEVENERMKHFLAARGEGFRARPMPSFYEEWAGVERTSTSGPGGIRGGSGEGEDGEVGEGSPSKKPEIRLNAAAILREDALYKKKQAEEAKMLETYELERRDERQFSEWQRTMRAKDEEARRRKVEALKKEMEAAFDKAVAAREHALVQNARKREEVKAESEALRLRREERGSSELAEAKERKAKVLAIETQARRKRRRRCRRTGLRRRRERGKRRRRRRGFTSGSARIASARRTCADGFAHSSSGPKQTSRTTRGKRASSPRRTRCPCSRTCPWLSSRSVWCGASSGRLRRRRRTRRGSRASGKIAPLW